MDTTISMLYDTGPGAGKPLVVLSEKGSYEDLVAGIKTRSRGRLVILEAGAITPKNAESHSETLQSLLREKQIRHAPYVAFGAASTVLQHMYLVEPRAVRSAVMVDPSTRPHPSKMYRIIDRVERALPLGLPLRINAEEFHSRSYLHRIRCPCLIVVSHHSTAYLQSEASVMARELPTAWKSTAATPETLNTLIDEFQGVAAKCPQR